MGAAEVNQSRLEFWNSRASLGQAAGTNDVTLKALEIQAISNNLRGCSFVLDAGCGNGFTTVSILKEMADVQMYGFDYSDAMIEEAKRLGKEEGVSDRLTLKIGDLTSPPFPNDFFDVAYTERSLINLNGVEEQKNAISAIAHKVKKAGSVILCESFMDGLDEINAFRVPIGLDAIEPPWHTHYFRIRELESFLPANVEIEKISNFSSTYYFLSRVVNAWLSQSDGVEPSYDAPINKLAFSLPNLELCSQTKIIVLRKH